MLRLAVLGGGNAACALAAEMAAQGVRVRLLERPGRPSRLDAVRARGAIRRTGPGRAGDCPIDAATQDPAYAVGDADLVFVAVPAFAHRAFAELTAPHLRPDAAVVVFTGALGGLEWRRAGFAGIIVDVDNLPFTARMAGPGEVAIHLDVPHLVAAAIPARRTADIAARLAALVPALRFAADAIESVLTNVNGVVHPPVMLLNVPRIDSARGQPWWIWEVGMTPSVARVVERLDGERRAIGAAFGVVLPDVATVLHRAGYGPGGTVWETINGCAALRRIRGPDDLQHRWITEDIPFALRLWADLARVAGVPCPVARAHVDLAGALTGRDWWAEGRALADYGLGGADAAALKRYLHEGELA